MNLLKMNLDDVYKAHLEVNSGDISSSEIITDHVGEGAINSTLPLENLKQSGYSTTDHDLEIFRKAENFKKIKLISGNQIEGGVTSDYIRATYGSRGVQRYKLAKFILTSLKYNLSPDVLLMLSCTNKSRVVVATAGAGKTTSLQFDLIISKMLDKALHEELLEPECIEGTSVKLSRILYLNYNKHNVAMIENRHRTMCATVNKFLREADAIDDNIESSTVHAFCHKWLKAFSTRVSLPDLAVVDESTKQSVWSAIITPRWAKYYDDSSCMVDYTVMDELYTYKVESMLDWDEFFDTAKFVDCGLKREFVKPCITKYDSMKRQMNLLDFTDYLLLTIDVLKNNPALKEELQHRYRVIIADENQDFTRLMNELLLQLYDPSINSLTVVGDPDQTIYDFKGVSPDNVVKLVTDLKDVQLLGLDTNYRCPDNIVTAAKAILNLNILRFEKPINTVRTGGKIITHPLEQGMAQDEQVLELLQRLDPDSLARTVIAYRNNVSSIILAEELFYSGIPFKILDSRRPFINPVFRHINGALRALKDKDDFNLNCELHRFLPMSKEMWTNILEENRLQRRMHFHDLYIADNLPAGSFDALDVLFRISNLIDTEPVCDYIGSLFKLYRKYYLNFIVSQNNILINEVDNYNLYLERAKKFFSRQLTYDYMMHEMRERNIDNEAGVTLSTFHGLKGLEFDYVIAVDFNESVFPNQYDIEQRYSRNTILEQKESANRLCYVLVTRTIKEFHMFYDAQDPSMYVNILTKALKSKSSVNDREPLTLQSVSQFNVNTAKMDFVKKLLGGK